MMISHRLLHRSTSTITRCLSAYTTPSACCWRRRPSPHEGGMMVNTPGRRYFGVFDRVKESFQQRTQSKQEEKQGMEKYVHSFIHVQSVHVYHACTKRMVLQGSCSKHRSIICLLWRIMECVSILPCYEYVERSSQCKKCVVFFFFFIY